MSEKEQDKTLAFDALFTTNQIQMYKILFSYLPAATRKQFAVYIKYMELQYTMSFFHKQSPEISRKLPHEDSISTESLFDELLPFCTPSQHTRLTQIKSMLVNFENMREMMETLQMFKELFPEGMGNASDNNSTDISRLFSILNSQDNSSMSSIFEMFQSSSADKNPPSEPDIEHE